MESLLAQYKSDKWSIHWLHNWLNKNQVDKSKNIDKSDYSIQ